MATKEVTLESGATLIMSDVPFAEARELEVAVASEFRKLKLDPQAEIDVNFIKDIALTAVSSKEIELALWKCLGRCTYNGNRIKKETFEPDEAREDFHQVCLEVAQHTLAPFMKNLFARLKPFIQMVKKSPA
jgi:hypothetical protein